MSTRPCKDCGGVVSTSANTCPHCHSRAPRGFFQGAPTLVLSVLGVGGLLWFLVAKFML